MFYLIDIFVIFKCSINREKLGDVFMLIQFSVSNFLSFDETETLSMIAGKARKNINRIYKSKK